ncbi:MAG: RNA polymerase sigma factor RpoD/SigA [Candidatus Pacebacteria bacterium]|nr:RNA polymerase sigma factor RpoD/SigA [Candidatus Paceibacterota bacterium]
MYMAEAGKTPLLKPTEEHQLALLIREGNEAARLYMIKANLRLVIKIAQDYQGCGLPLLDMINEGNIGLMEGVERYDPNRGAKVSTYTSWWIKQRIKRALANQSRTIRLPVHVVDQLAHLRRAETKLHEMFGCEPTNEELAAELGISERKVEFMKRSSCTPVPLDAPVNEDSETTIAEHVADSNAIDPSSTEENSSDLGLLREVLGQISERERTILEYRFGLNDGTEKTLEKVGEKFGVTRERIRQIQNQALSKLQKLMCQKDNHVGH